MRKIIIAISTILISTNLSALEIKDRIITVTSSAETFVLPDEIEMEITLEEEGGNSFLAKIEQSFWGELKEQEIGKKQLVMNNVNVMYYWYYWWKTRNVSKKSKKIVLKLNHKTDFMKLMKGLNKDWVVDIKIIGVSNRNIKQYIKETQLKAMKSAKEKASYLLKSIDEEVGRVVSIVELDVQKAQGTNMHIESGKYYSSSYRKTGGGFFENIPEIRLHYAVKTKFEIK